MSWLIKYDIEIYKTETKITGIYNDTINLKQTHLINGLFSFDIPEMKKIIDKENYTIITKHSFIDLALNSFTFGIYSPTTIIIKH